MSWRVIVYILVGLFVVFVVLPKLLALLADAIHRYMTPPKDKQDKH